MANINTTLNLNKTPQLVSSNSLIFAKNIRLDIDDTIHSDYGIFPLSILSVDGIDNTYENIFFRIELDVNDNIFSLVDEETGHYVLDDNGNTILDTSYKIVGVVTASKEFYLFISNGKTHRIIRYDEHEHKFNKCDCNWTYSGGKITGKVINNLRGEKILNIGESNTDSLVPFKSINLNKSKIDDDESIYTQTPNVPLLNINFIGTFNYRIPNGCYQFFVRYKIRDNFYTNWFPASKELFAGNNFKEDTNYGTVSYINTHLSSNISFVLEIDSVFESETFANLIKHYESFQIGFILSSDDAIYGRAWKHFDWNTKVINFDYKSTDGKEIEVIDLISTTYQLYNVGNITNFKTKLYLSNYIETNFNPDYEKIAKDIEVKIEGHNLDNENENNTPTINNNPVIFYNDDSKIVTGLALDGDESNSLYITSNESTIGNDSDTMLSRAFDIEFSNVRTDNPATIADIIRNSIEIPYFNNLTKLDDYNGSSELYDIKFSAKGVNQRDFINELINYLRKNHLLADSTNPYDRYDFNKLIFDKDNKIYQPIDNITDITIRWYDEKNTIVSSSFIIDTSKDEEFIPDKITELTIGEIYNKILNGNPRELKSGSGLDLEKGINNQQLGVDLHSKIGIIKNNDLTYFSSSGKNIEIVINRDIYLYSHISSNPVLHITSFPTTITININAWKWKYDYFSIYNSNVQNSLVPYQYYKFFVHFIKKNGEITNGYPCNNNEDVQVPYRENANVVNYPIFTNIEIPEEYDGCFFSILRTKNNVATAYSDVSRDSSTDYMGEYLSLDVDLGHIGEGENLQIKQGTDAVYYGKYHFSSDSSNAKYFGANGVIRIQNNTGIDFDKLLYIIEDYNLPQAEDSELIKCTPYINKKYNSYDDWQNLNLPGFICNVYPLSISQSIQYYNDGSNVFSKSYDNNSPTNLKLLNFKEFKEPFYLLSTRSKKIYSNYNLNYVALRQDLTSKMISIKDETSTNTDATYTTYIYRLIPSLILCQTYELPTMYFNYTRKTYSTYKNNEITKFDNTIRSSIPNEDEGTINIFKFNSFDYYNIPTDKDIITNLIAVGDAILVHTKDSMFKFSGSNNLQSTNGEIQTNENDVFNSGVSEVFGSEFGFAGLQNKEHSIVCESGYIFFDKDSNVIYMYSGNNQLEKLNEPIEKLFRYKPIDNIYFASDYYNNRIFICINFEDDTKVTLSYNPDKKKFISLHDFWFNNSFNTKNNCYFVTENKDDICTVDTNKHCCYTKLYFADSLYPQITETRQMPVRPRHQSSRNVQVNSINYNLHKCKSIIDIIENSNYEVVKTLNAIHWCSSYYEDEFKQIDEKDLNTLKLSETFNTRYPCDNMRIYTDTCLSDLIDLKDISNDYALNDISNYKAVRYNQGRWTLNYFRNIQNANDNIKKYVSDQNSLIEGKYFVIRFIFNSEFKLESLSLNYNDKL